MIEPLPPPAADELRPKETRVRTWDLVVQVSGYMPGELVDWPANIFDRIAEGVEALEKRTGLKLDVTRSYCEREPEGDCYVHVIVQHVPKFVRLVQ